VRKLVSVRESPQEFEEAYAAPCIPYVGTSLKLCSGDVKVGACLFEAKDALPIKGGVVPGSDYGASDMVLEPFTRPVREAVQKLGVRAWVTRHPLAEVVII
jgi:hypothetical protein